MKRKIGLLLALAALAAMLASCGQPASYENMGYIRHADGSYGDQIKRGDTVYQFWGAADTDLIDKQIGIIDGEKNDKVYSVQGYSSDEWIIHHLDVIMSTYEIYKAESVTDIPDEFTKSKVQ